MIISFEPSKDTYVTNRKLQFNDGINANTGQAATIDIFKLYNENENMKSEFVIKFNSLPIENEIFKIEDANKNQVEFIFSSNKENTDLNYGDLKLNTSYVEIGLGLTNSEYSLTSLISHIVNIVNSITTNQNNGKNLNIAAKIVEDTILLTQNNKGSKGDTFFSGSFNNVSNKTFIDGFFKRVEYSCGLISFDLAEIKNNYVQGDFSKSVFSNKENFKASIVLKDVGTYQTTPKDLNLKLYPLLKDFEEGLGRDVIYYSDFDTCNFVYLDQKNNVSWENEGRISLKTDVTSSLNSQNVTSSFYLETGAEDVDFDITDYFYEYFSGSHSVDKGFLLSISQEALDDNFSYFVKRLGTRHLKNKINVPELKIKIKDEKIQTYQSEDNKSFLDKNETFYLFNNTSEFENSKNVVVEFKYTSGSINVLENNNFDHIVTGSDIYDFKGNKINNIKKFEVNHPDLSIFTSNQFIKSKLLTEEKLDVDLRFFYKDGNIEYDIKNSTKPFYKKNYSEEKKLTRTRFSILEKDLLAYDDSKELKLTVFFYDLDKQYKSNKEKFSLECLNLGVVSYEIYDIDTGEILVKKEKEYTDLVYDGSNYILRMHVNKKFKNRRLSFIMYYTDLYSNQEVILKDKNIFIRL